MKTSLQVRLTSTSFYDGGDGENEKRIKKYNYEYVSNNHTQEEHLIIPNNDVLYTLIWFDCEDCKNLIKYLKQERKRMLYINGGYYFFDENDKTSTPLFYKNDELIATDLFSIYEEICFNKKDE